MIWIYVVVFGFIVGLVSSRLTCWWLLRPGMKQRMLEARAMAAVRSEQREGSSVADGVPTQVPRRSKARLRGRRLQ